VNAGSIAVFVAVLPQNGEPRPPANRADRACLDRADARRSTPEESCRSLLGIPPCLLRSHLAQATKAHFD